MACKSPECTGERDRMEVVHEVLYHQRRMVVRRVPAAVCPHCGDLEVAEETLSSIDLLLITRGGEAADLAYEA